MKDTPKKGNRSVPQSNYVNDTLSVAERIPKTGPEFLRQGDFGMIFLIGNRGAGKARHRPYLDSLLFRHDRVFYAACTTCKLTVMIAQQSGWICLGYPILCCDVRFRNFPNL